MMATLKSMALAATLIIPTVAGAPQQDPTANPKAPPREPGTPAPPQDKGGMDLLEDRTVVLVGRVVRKDDGKLVLRVKEFSITRRCRSRPCSLIERPTSASPPPRAAPTPGRRRRTAAANTRRCEPRPRSSCCRARCSRTSKQT
ncbi:MAG: hypothetical protein U1E76_24215 [Planctomycetota bacterium]